MNKYEAYRISCERKHKRPFLRDMTRDDSITYLRNIRKGYKEYNGWYAPGFNPLLELLGRTEYIRTYKEQKALNNPAYKVNKLPLP